MMTRFGRKRAKPSVITLADQARDQGQWERAAGYYREALQRMPQNPPIWVQFGHVLKEAGHWAEAERAYRTAMAQDPASADPHLHLGHILKIQGRKEEARTAYLRAVAIDPSLDGVSFEFSQLGWSEAHVSVLKAMLQSDALHHPLLAPDGQRLDGVVAHSIIEDSGQQVVLAENQFEGRRDYAEWVRLYDKIDDGDRRAITAAVGDMTSRPLISVVMPVYNTPEAYLRAAIDSVRQQLYPNWELCVADDASTAAHVSSILEHYRAIDPRIKVRYRSENGNISAASNSALALATGSFIALLDHDDVLPEHALYMVAAILNSDPEVDLIYSDDDKIDENGQRFDPHFKSDWNPDLMLSQNFFSNLGVYRRSLIEKVGGFRRGYEGSQDYDLVLRAQSRTTPDRIRHIPHILYHRRAIPGTRAFGPEEKECAVESARHAIRDHLKERRITANVSASRCPSFHRVRYALPEPVPRVTIIIPTRDRVDLLRRCIEGLLHRTDYPDIEILIVDNQSKDSATHDYFDRVVGDKRVHVLSHEMPFNFSAINNFAASRAAGSVLCLLNNDVEVINSDWLDEMVSHALRPGVGAVGALLYYPDGQIQHAGVVIGRGGIAGHIHTGLRRGEFGYFGRAAILQNLSAVTAACLVMSKAVFDEVGGLNEKDLTVSYNDVDLCLRIREAGYRIVWTPYAELYHHESASRGSDADPDNIARSDAEASYMSRRWSHILKCDPYYNPNLRLDGPAFGLAFPPRVDWPWRHEGSGRNPAVDFSKDARLIVDSGLFDPAWYLAQNPDVAAADVEPLAHYLASGYAEGRRPGPVFDPTAYHAQDPNPLPHRKHTDNFRLVYVSGEPQTPGHQYRVIRPMALAARLGVETCWMRIDEIPARLAEIRATDALILWRAPWDQHVSLAVDTARQSGAKVLFDVDDLMIDPELARLDVIDGIRTQGFTEEPVRQHYARTRSSMWAADLCLATTDELATRMRQAGMPTIVLPNGFDCSTLGASRLSARRREIVKAEDLFVRIGFAGGTHTHQRDFAVCAETIAEILRNHPECRLVAFRSANGAELIDVEEFSALRGLEDRIEWRDFVPLERLPYEIARFDVNIVPLEVGNPYCEAKSELKFFEAALAGVPTIASSTGPYRRAIRHGETGFLASKPSDWRDALTRLVADPSLRRQVSAAAYRDAIWNFGPERATESMALLLDLLRGGRTAARAFAVYAHRNKKGCASMPTFPAHEIVFRVDHLDTAQVTVAVPLYNYAEYVREALDSVRAQTLQRIDLVVIDDNSTDNSLSVALDWVKANVTRFNRVSILHNCANSGLGLTRNLGFEAAETPFVLPLDADNRLLPDCAAACLKKVEATGAAFAYPVIKEFGEREGLIGVSDYDPVRLANGNYIDAMALVSKAVWAAVGGYDAVRTGWEDFDFWCKLAERGLWGVKVPGGPFAEYRVHSSSMIQSDLARPETFRAKLDHVERRHPWLTHVWPLPNSSREPDIAVSPIAGRNDRARLIKFLPILRCPETGGRLTLTPEGDELVSEDGSRHWPLVLGRALLFPGMRGPKVNSDAHLSNPLPDSALALIRSTRGLVLHLSAGGTRERYDNVVEAEAAIFRHTDFIADVHRLPFADEQFEAVISLNAFEHYRDPWQAAREIHRVLQPGGRVLIHTAFLQPLHEAPWHFYNCTRYGLEAWLEEFETERLHVSGNFHAGYSLSWLASECEAALRRRLSAAAADSFLAAPIGRLASLWRAPETQKTDPLWFHMGALPQDVQEVVGAGFEYLGRRPEYKEGCDRHLMQRH
jgi:glycosyltransferase involved in cell wall biosynthesis/SAM-dependent methyltransferase